MGTPPVAGGRGAGGVSIDVLVQGMVANGSLLVRATHAALVLPVGQPAANAAASSMTASSGEGAAGAAAGASGAAAGAGVLGVDAALLSDAPPPSS